MSASVASPVESIAGRHVILSALAKRPELNGLCALAERYDEASGRYVVRLPSEAGAKKKTAAILLKAANLGAVERDAARSIAGFCGAEHAEEVRDRVRTAEAGKRHEDSLSAPGIPLDLEQTGLRELPASVGTLSLVTALWLGSNHLTSLPLSIGSLVNLRNLDVDGNSLQSLPATIGNLQQLQSLYANANQLTELPDAIGNLSALKELRLSDNRLRTLPSALGKLRLLRSLWLERNRDLVVLPACIGALSALEELDLSGNAITSPPVEVVARGVAAIRKWLQATAADPQPKVEYVVEPEGSMHAPLPEGMLGGSGGRSHPAVSGATVNAEGGEFILDPSKLNLS